MSYYFLRTQKKIPGFVAYSVLFLLTLAVGFTLNSTRMSTVTRASKALVLSQLKVSNITASSATISFFTPEATTAYISVQADKWPEPRIGFDFEDGKIIKERKLHYITLDNLLPNSRYTYKVYLAKKEPLSGQAYTFHTLADHFQSSKSSSEPFFGKVLFTNLQPASETLIYVSFPEINKSLWYSAISKDTGEWVITIPLVYTQKFTLQTLTDSNEVRMYFFKSPQVSSSVQAFVGEMSPLKTVIIGESYDLRQEKPESSSPVLGIADSREGLRIVSPQFGSIVSTQYPVIKGVAAPHSLINIKLSPYNVGAVLQTNKTGEWKYTFTKPLAPGTYEFVAEQGKKVEAITFSVGKSGESVLGNATSSASLTPTTVPTEAITQPPGPIGGIISPTTLPLPTVATKSIPSAGSNTNLIIGIASGLSLLGLIFVLY